MTALHFATMDKKHRQRTNRELTSQKVPLILGMFFGLLGGIATMVMLLVSRLATFWPWPF